MSAALLVRPFEAAEWPLYRTLRLRALAEAPLAFGSTLAAEAARSDADWAWRLHVGANSRDAQPLVAQLAGVAVGLAWIKRDAADAALVHLFQMWVAPAARGQGVASALLEQAIGWSRTRNAHTLALAVVCGNSAAEQLYRRHGFTPHGAPTPQRPGAERHEQALRLALQ